MDIWQDALETFFCGDADLIRYVQEIAGLSAIGKVCVEALIIAYGEGRNGKSTFWNTLSHVLGTYSGNMSADTLTVGCKRNVKPELAEAKGKRLIIAAELEEGMRLSTSNVKQLCSTDEIYAEKKYKDPFSYVPSHTLVLYTNHLPKVGAIDAGTWRRLIVIPFNARIEGNSDIKNYADFLFDKGGGAILKWIMVGAKRVIDNDYHTVDRHAVYSMTTGSFTQVAEEKAPTVLARDYKDPTAVCYGIGRDTFNQGQNAKLAPTFEKELQPTLVAKGPGAIQSGYTVRRLTPTECARLQGFPDSWCADLGTEKPTDEEMYFWYKVFKTYAAVTGCKMKSDAQIAKWLRNPHSDSAEYKMWGNGVALPCVWFVLSGIVWYAQSESEYAPE